VWRGSASARGTYSSEDPREESRPLTDYDAGPTGREPLNDDVDRPSTRRPRRRGGRIAAWLVAGAFVAIVAFAGTSLYTDRPEFCTTCHEMVPYYDAWAAGPHSDVSCIRCHVDAGLPARFEHKFIALGEVRSHFSGDTRFPRQSPPDVPSARCVRCHPSVPETTEDGFPHGKHVDKGTCAGCHPDTGHLVTPAALQAAGIYQPSTPPTIPAGLVAAVGAGSANIPRHVEVSCSGCHDLAKTGCAACHTSEHKPIGDCLLCHRPGEKWEFVHPMSGVDCSSCHERPEGHVDDGDCLRCHDKPGRNWKYTHERGEQCEPCHQPPADHRKGACAGCHKQAGRSWAFSHPGSSSNCRTCHQAPSGHYAGACVRCHSRVGKSFAFNHPSAGEHSWRSKPCKKCHPSGTATVSCTCHGGRPPRD
jgi:hypothetical protein